MKPNPTDDLDIDKDVKDNITTNIKLIFENITSKFPESVTEVTVKGNENIQNKVYNFYKKEYFIYLNLLIDMLIIQFMYVHTQSTSTTFSDGVLEKSEQNFPKTSTATHLIPNLLKLENFREILIAYNDLNYLYNDLYKFKVDLYIGCLESIISGENYHTHTSNIKDNLEYLKDIDKYNYIHIYTNQESITDENLPENKVILSQDAFLTNNSDTRISQIFKDIERMYITNNTSSTNRYEVHAIKELFIDKYDKPLFNINLKTYEFDELKKYTKTEIDKGEGEDEIKGEGEKMKNDNLQGNVSP